MEKFPESTMVPKVLLESADIYYREIVMYPQYEELAIKQYEKVIEKFPKSEEARIARRRIQYIKENPLNELE